MDALLKAAKTASVEAAPVTNQFESSENLQLFINKLGRVFSITCSEFTGMSYEDAMVKAKDVFKSLYKKSPYSGGTMFGAGEMVTLWESIKWTVAYVTKGLKRPIYLAHVDRDGVNTTREWNCILTNPPIENRVHTEIRDMVGIEIRYGNISMTIYEVKL